MYSALGKHKKTSLSIESLCVYGTVCEREYMYVGLYMYIYKCYSFPRVLVLCEMQSVSSRIWTRVAMSISCDDNHYTTGISWKWPYTFSKLGFNIVKKEQRIMWLLKILKSSFIGWFLSCGHLQFIKSDSNFWLTTDESKIFCTIFFLPSHQGLKNAPTASLQKGKTPLPKRVSWI